MLTIYGGQLVLLVYDFDSQQPLHANACHMTFTLRMQDIRFQGAWLHLVQIWLCIANGTVLDRDCVMYVCVCQTMLTFFSKVLRSLESFLYEDFLMSMLAPAHPYSSDLA